MVLLGLRWDSRGELVTDGLQAAPAQTQQLDVLLGRDDADLSSHQEAQSPAGPGAQRRTGLSFPSAKRSGLMLHI